ncbi:amino acid carrier protein [Anaerococcus tetradius]|uniref:Amino acid carrier protein n=2 Tax=Anaerococcus tetradius TaxID=33036 RepID=A0A133KI42_9FIRM|nr:amino acid carrier protein [Anaerococcus tetradius]
MFFFIFISSIYTRVFFLYFFFFLFTNCQKEFIVIKYTIEDVIILFKTLIEINGRLGTFLWGYPMIVTLFLGGLYLIFRSRFWVYRNFFYIFSQTFGKPSANNGSTDTSISPFQAVSTALAGTIGAGSIIGVSTAIEFGGPGSIFWMWMAALVCMTTKMCEVSLAVATREIDGEGKFVGGPMYYISKGAKKPILAKLFAFFSVIAILGTGGLVQANSISESINDMCGLSLRTSGILIVVLMLMVLVGGIKRIGAFAEKIVPFMALFYVAGSILIIFLQRKYLLDALYLIVSDAFSGKSMLGGACGSGVLMSIRWGLARGIFSNEAGLGTAPMAHASSHTDHPIRQGMWGAVEVFVSSLVICTMTALVIITSGLWTDPNLSGASLTAAAFSKSLPMGRFIVSISLILFAFTTAVSWCYYGQRSVFYLSKSDKASSLFKYVYIGFCYLGAIGGLKFAWNVADTANALMVIPNVVALILMAKSFYKLLRDFDYYKDTNKKGDYTWTYDNKWKSYFKD